MLASEKKMGNNWLNFRARVLGFYPDKKRDTARMMATNFITVREDKLTCCVCRKEGYFPKIIAHEGISYFNLIVSEFKLIKVYVEENKFTIERFFTNSENQLEKLNTKTVLGPPCKV